MGLSRLHTYKRTIHSADRHGARASRTFLLSYGKFGADSVSLRGQILDCVGGAKQKEKSRGRGGKRNGRLCTVSVAEERAVSELY